jgi:hypothetical protein
MCRPRTMARVARLRADAAAHLESWSRMHFEAKRAMDGPLLRLYPRYVPCASSFSAS